MDRDGRIARSVALAITSRAKKQPRSTLASIFALLSAVFSFFELPLNKVSAESFARLRREHWKLIDGDYAGSFTSGDGRPEDALHSIGDMGFSGSVSLEILVPREESAVGSHSSLDLLRHPGRKVPHQVGAASVGVLLLPG